MKKIRRKGIIQDDELTNAINSFGQEGKGKLEAVQLMVRNGNRVLSPNAEAAYLSFIAYYLARTERLKLEQGDVMDMASHFATACGLHKPPQLSGQLASKLTDK